MSASGGSVDTGTGYGRPRPTTMRELTDVGAGTPMGELLRRYWHPVGLAGDASATPRALRVLGEDLVLFRDGGGRPGLVTARCAHRGTTLYYGRVEERGIRCCYHGWLFDVDGTILETPGEPATSTLKDRLYHGAYPTHEQNGIVFAYMGPPEEQPPPPKYDSFSRPGYRLMPGRKYYYPCNWLQILENTVDPVHTAFLHTIVSGSQFTDEFGKVPELDFMETPVGVIYVATRRVGDNIWARMVENVLPNLQQVAPIWEDGHQEHPFNGPMLSRWVVPIDDTNTLFIELRHVSETARVTPGWWADRDIMAPGQLAADAYEASQRQPGDYEAQVSQRPIAVHGLEHLGATDRGVIMFRQRLRHGIRTVQGRRTPDGLCREAGTIIGTYCNDTVVRVPPAPTAEEDRQLMRTMGRKLAESYLAHPPLLQYRPARYPPE
jgi:phenylpropionate dioxygenase-like ring-hydroxylating dioxygenase large terminal subunit